jgi:hypothetical protein
MKNQILRFPRQAKVSIFLMTALLVVNTGCNNDDDSPDQPTPPANLNPGPCDEGLALDSTDPMEGAKAIDLCAVVGVDGSTFGLVDASYSRFNGSDGYSPLQIGVRTKFGFNNLPQHGESFLALSSGYARTFFQAGACGTSSCSASGMGVAPSGYPIQIPGCASSNAIYDDVCMVLTLKSPASARGFSIDHSMFTFDYPNFVCGPFNDQFLILIDPEVPVTVGGNVAMDGNSRPMGANASFMGDDLTDLFAATGFGDSGWGAAGTTGWLRTTVPVNGSSEFILKFVIFDVGDQGLDSTVLLDNFQWLTDTPTLETVAL